ncbi:uncharacterized protein LOC143475951 [Brachyhypopomus gauderio]|uniref:uncharacterized protein LOC143475951 n=1 Tax=Brachyhypopomus gauderio TaxID=698409 RepID=UPI0040414988
MKYKRYLVEEKDIPRTTQHRWKRRIKHGMKGQQSAGFYMLKYHNDIQPLGDQDLSRLHRTGKSLENKTADESKDDYDQSVTDSPVRISYQEEHHVEHKTTDYQDKSSEDDGEDIQHDKDITDNEMMENRSNDERQPSDLIQPNEKALHEQRRKEHELLLLALKSKHCLTDEALEDILKVINVVTGKHSVSTTKYHLYKNVNDYKDYILVKHVCSECTILMENVGESHNYETLLNSMSLRN